MSRIAEGITEDEERAGLTPEEKANGWTLAQAREYRASRERALGIVGGNVVTQFQRPRPAVRIENIQSYRPFAKR